MAGTERSLKLITWPAASRWDTDICDTCHNLGLPTPKFKVIRVDYFELLESTKLQDCIYCSLIFHALTKANAGISRDGYSLVEVYAKKGKPLFVSWDGRRKGDQYLEIYRTMIDPSRHPIKDLGYAPDIARDANDDFLVRQILTWIVECEGTHPACQSNTVYRPKRLLNVGNSEMSPIRLVEDHYFPKYVALSHCWGAVRSCITTKENVHSRMQQIGWDELPKTFQDSVSLARKLGIQNIWIDSLCIVQDDLHDWELESVRMGDIYEGAAFTIAASLAPGDGTGFLHADPSRALFQGEDLRFDFRGKGVDGVRVRKPHDVLDHGVVEPLSTRGWTLQERLMSTRLLSFSSGATFECKTSTKCECGHSIYGNKLLPALKKRHVLDKKSFQSVVISGCSGTSAIYDYWSSFVVPHYTARSLTKDSDRLPAIQSLANIFQQKLADEYVFGLWRGDLQVGISWAPANRRYDSHLMPCGPDGLRLPEAIRAPSWSWASVEGAVNLIRDWDEYSCEIMDIERTSAEGAWLFMEAPFVELSVLLTIFLNQSSQVRIRRTGMPSDAFVEVPPERLRFDTPVNIVNARRISGDDFISLQRSKKPLQWPYTRSRITVFAAKLTRMDSSYRFLLLGGCPTVPGAYQRIGILNVLDNDLQLQDMFQTLPIRQVKVC